MKALLIGVVMVAVFFALSAAVIAAAPYIAVGVIIWVAICLLSKSDKKPSDDT